MLYKEREAFIKKELEIRSIVKTNELVESMNISIDTIRRDLKRMESDGLLKCVRGGATTLDHTTLNSPFIEREIINIENKRMAAKKAIEYIQEGFTIALNAGTTNTILATELINLKFNFTVITNNLPVISILSQVSNIEVIAIGGFLDKTENAFYGKTCETEFKQFNPDISFLSINAVSIENGFSDFRYNDFPIINTLIKKSNYTIVVMDSSKLNTKSKKNLFKLNEVNLLISDNNVSEHQKEAFKEHGLKLV